MQKYPHPKLFLIAGYIPASGGIIMKIGAKQFILTLLCFMAVLMNCSTGTSFATSGFDMKGTITHVLSPASIVVGNVTVNLDGINSSGLSSSAYFRFMEELKSYYIGKDVLVRGNYAYFDLHGSYNSESINEMIQRQISDQEAAERYRMPYNYSIISTLYRNN